MDAKDFFFTLKRVFSNWRYFLFVVFVAFTFYSLNVLIASYSSLDDLYNRIGFIGTTKIFYTFLIGFRSTTFLHIYINVIALSISLGVLMSLIAYKINMLKEFSGKTGALTTTGIFLGIIAPGCAACSVGLLSLFGISAAALNFLPLKGAELSFLSTAIILFIIVRAAKDIDEGIKCEIKS